tara:strand:+ start:19226 stop:19663 length:438 start_codon:yes stop_codon:yes gene_type:complete
MTKYIAIDPGIKKCGLILADINIGSILEAKIAYTNSVNDLIQIWEIDHEINLILMGNGTNSIYLKNHIKSKSNLPIELVIEKNTTLRARERYWEIWPKNFFISLIPDGMILPPVDLDAIAALILLEDYLEVKFDLIEKNDFKIWP